MRIYILSNINIVKNILTKLDPYFYETRHISYIWSMAGLLQIENDKIYKVKIKDVATKKTLIGAYPTTIDESEFIREEECYQIAPRSHKEFMTHKSYRFPSNSSLEWILEYKGDELHDNYFTLPHGKEITPKIKTEILEFLNL